jgi:hypothetical protein
MGSFPINVEKLRNLSSKTKVGAWATTTKGTEWLIVLQLDSEHGCGQKKITFSLLLPNCVE